ncbi:RING-H2 finger protein ATL57-like [Carex rostrata]
MLDSGLNLATTLVGFVVSLGLIIFVCARVVCGRSESVDLRTVPYEFEMRSQMRATQNIMQPECIVDGLEPVVIAAMPTLKYIKQPPCVTEDQCTICLGEYEERDILRIMPTCGHNFHSGCIDVWLESHSTCPICRVSLNHLFAGNYVTTSRNTMNRNAFFRHFVNQWETSNHSSLEIAELDR